MSADQYRAMFLHPFDDDSVEEAGFEFANALTEDYRQEWWQILIQRVNKRYGEWIKEEQEYCRIMDSIERYDQMDPDEIETDEYERLMTRQEELRNKGHPEP